MDEQFPLYVVVDMPCCGEKEFLYFSCVRHYPSHSCIDYEGEHGDKIEVSLTIRWSTKETSQSLRELRLDPRRQTATKKVSAQGGGGE